MLSRRILEIDVISDQAISIDSSDVFTAFPDGLDMSLDVKAPWMDVVRFTNTDQSKTCKSIANADVPIYFGPIRINMGNNVNLTGLTDC